jgi:hypothetical protein
MNSAFGAILGALVLVGGPELMRMTQDARLLSYGVLLLLLIRFRPHGLWARCGPSTVSPSRYWKVDDHEDGPRPGKTENAVRSCWMGGQFLEGPAQDLLGDELIREAYLGKATT